MTTPIASSVRPGLLPRQSSSTAAAGAAPSPHTPTSRFISSTFSSPGSSSFRQEEDAVIIELGSRYLRAGFEGESGPQCVIPFNAANARRVGDYRDVHRQGAFERWAEKNEMWRGDLQGLELGLVEDKLERAVREAYSKYLLVDAGTARLVLVLPSLVPHPILSTVLTALFDRWNYPTITLLPSPTMVAVSAGVRSGLVVDVGWEETVITVVYEYRELRNMRSVRGVKMLVEQLGEALKGFARENSTEGEMLKVDYDFVEELLIRSAFCMPPQKTQVSTTGLEEKAEGLKLEEGKDITHDKDLDEDEGTKGKKDTAEEKSQLPGYEDLNSDIEVDWPCGTTSKPAKIPTSTISDCVQRVFCEEETEKKHHDDHEQSLPEMVYNSLLSQEPDVRGISVSRIMFTGGGANIPGLCSRILEEAKMLVKKHGWTHVRGKRVDEQRAKLGELAQGRTRPPSARHDVPIAAAKGDFVEEKLLKQRAKYALSHTSGKFRQTHSLGAWAGASLLASLKVKGFVEVEREKFMSHGLTGASREAEISVIPQRMGSFGISAVKSIDRSNWTLAGWG